MNVARIGLLLAGFPDSVPGITINRFCSSGCAGGGDGCRPHTPGRGRRHDRRRHREHEHGAAGRQQADVQSGDIRERREHRDRLRHGHHRRESRRSSGKSAASSRTCSPRKAIAARCGRRTAASSRTRSRPMSLSSSFPILTRREIGVKTRDGDERRRPAPRHLAGGPREIEPGIRGQGQRDRRQQLADVRRRRSRGADERGGDEALQRWSPLGRFMGYAVAGVPPEIMGIGPVKAIPESVAAGGAQAQDDLDWIELNEAFAAQSLAVIKDLGLDPPRRSIRSAARSRSAIRSARPAPARRDADARPAPAQEEVRHGHDVHRAPAWALRAYSKRCNGTGPDWPGLMPVATGL